MFITVKPSKKDLKVFNPQTNRHLDMEPTKVNRSIYWIRRISEGDVVQLDENDEVIKNDFDKTSKLKKDKKKNK